jgi:hypothetical protein
MNAIAQAAIQAITAARFVACPVGIRTIDSTIGFRAEPLDRKTQIADAAPAVAAAKPAALP